MNTNVILSDIGGSGRIEVFDLGVVWKGACLVDLKGVMHEVKAAILVVTDKRLAFEDLAGPDADSLSLLAS